MGAFGELLLLARIPSEPTRALALAVQTVAFAAIIGTWNLGVDAAVCAFVSRVAETPT